MKKQIVSLLVAGLGVFALAGCPVYDDDGGYYGDDTYGCYSDNDCSYGYSCQDNACVPWSTTDASTGGGSCFAPGDCPNGYTCDSSNQCSSSGCEQVGCASGYICVILDGQTQCAVQVGGPDGSTTDGSGGGGGPGDGGTDSSTDSSTPDSGPAPQCSSDPDCAADGGSGSKCLDGTCVAPVNQCSDGTQCTGGQACVAGVCTPSCTGGAVCPTGFSCNTTTGVCTGNPTPCGEAADAGTCGGGTTCVDERCVPSCGDGGTCPTGDVCVGGGCIPDQKPQFVCQADGVGPGCAAGSTCLHHNCYIGCDGDASNACATADPFNVCKPVTTSGNTYDVCGSNSNLGSECDPTISKACADPNQVCIDGYCH
jgi:hypothetical protein